MIFLTAAAAGFPHAVFIVVPRSLSIVTYILTHFDSRKVEANQQSQGSLESCARAAALGRELSVADYLPTVGAKPSTPPFQAPRSNRYSLDLIERDFIAGAIVKLRRARAFVSCPSFLSI
jgi:hypothetical protein